MTNTREFPLSVVVSVTKNRLVAPFDEYRGFLDYMTGTHVPLWDVERARKAVAEKLTRLFRKIPDPPEKTDSGNASRYVKACAKKLGYETVAFTGGKIPFEVRTATESAP